MSRYSQTFSFPADSQEFEKTKILIHRFLSDHLVNEEDIYHIELILEELIANIIDHSFRDRPPGTIKVKTSIDPYQTQLVITDNGRPFDPISWVPSSLEDLVHKRKKRGLGIKLISLLVDQLSYKRLPKGFNQIEVTKTLIHPLPEALPKMKLKGLNVFYLIPSKELRGLIRDYLASFGCHALSLPSDPKQLDPNLIPATYLYCFQAPAGEDLSPFLKVIKEINPQAKILACVIGDEIRTLEKIWESPYDAVFLSEWGKKGLFFIANRLTDEINAVVARQDIIARLEEQENRLVGFEQRWEQSLMKLTALFEQVRDINLDLDQTRIAETLLFTVMGQFAAQTAALFASSKKEKKYRLISAKGLRLSNEQSFSSQGKLVSALRKTDQAIFIGGEEKSVAISAAEKKLLGDLKAALVFALKIGGKLVGILTVGDRLDNQLYSSEDLDFIRLLGSQVAVALENARLVQELTTTLDYVRRQQEQIITSEKMAEVGRMAAGIAHEINNPLTAIIGLSDGLLGSGRLDEKTTSRINIILKEGERISQLTTNLLSFSRPKPPTILPVNLAPLLEETFLLLQYQLKKAQIEVHTSFPESDPIVMGDANKLKQVFINLTVNACHAMPDGGDLEISVTPWKRSAPGKRVSKNYFRIDFRDHGVGIPHEIMDQIFEPFFTTKGEGKGTGLGLFITQDIIGRHKGFVELQSEVGKGTVFSLFLPGKT